MALSMNVRDYAETAKIAAMIGGGGLLIYGIYKSGIFQGLGKVSGAIGQAVEAVKNDDDVKTIVKGGQVLTDSLHKGGVGLGSGDIFGFDYWWLNPSLMIPWKSTEITLDQAGVKATSAYIVVRARDYDSAWRIKSSAYTAAVKMHSGNEAILQKHVLTNMKLKPELQNLAKLADFVVVYADGSIRSA